MFENISSYRRNRDSIEMMEAQSRARGTIDFELQVAAAIAIAGAIFIGWTSGVADRPIGIPLWGFAAQLRDRGLLELLRFSVIGVVLWKGLGRLALGAAASFAFIYWIARYSLLGAFAIQIGFNCIFLLAIWNADRNSRRFLASVFLAGIFLSAAFQKINGSYLSGLEFSNPGGLLGPFLSKIGMLPNAETGVVLAIISIAFELGLGFGLLIGKRIFVHFSILFILLLSLMSPPVSFVYLCIAGIGVLADPFLLAKVKETRFALLVKSVFFWLVLCLYLLPSYDLTAENISAPTFLIRPILFVVAFCGIHLYLLFCSFKSPSVDPPFLISFKENKRSSVAILLLFVVGFLSFRAGAPSPIGLSMFSAQVRKSSKFEMEIKSAEDCSRLFRLHKYVTIADTEIRSQGSECVISIPTESGLAYFERMICEYGLNGEIVTKNSERNSVTRRKCHD